ncbi:MAG: hypothetical protein KF716_12825 [Anaerolineae bacterium]|nr:hypothetical protein [Anaerolineae bacterium]
MLHDEFTEHLHVVYIIVGSMILSALLAGVVDLRQGIRLTTEIAANFLLYWVVMLGLYLLFRLFNLFLQAVRGDF